MTALSAISSPAAIVPHRARCACGCGTEAIVGVAAIVPGAALIAQRAFQGLGWMAVEGEWRAPACWRRLVAARGPDDGIAQAIVINGQARAIRVEGVGC